MLLDTSALSQAVYEELRLLAAARIAHDAAGASLHPTSLAHQALVRIVGSAAWEAKAWNGKAHFFGAAALAMRRILIERARSHRVEQRMRAAKPADLLAADPSTDISHPSRATDLLALDEALDALEKDNPWRARVVLLRFFAGLSVQQTAELLEVSQPTIKREWAYAKAWILCRMRAE